MTQTNSNHSNHFAEVIQNSVTSFNQAHLYISNHQLIQNDDESSLETYIIRGTQPDQDSNEDEYYGYLEDFLNQVTSNITHMLRTFDHETPRVITLKDGSSNRIIYTETGSHMYTLKSSDYSIIITENASAY